MAEQKWPELRLFLRLGVRFSGIGGASGVIGGLTPRHTDCTLELSVEVVDRLLSDGRELHKK
jgi:hypothetical protein